MQKIQKGFFFSFLVKGEGKEKKRPLLALGYGT